MIEISTFPKTNARYSIDSLSDKGVLLHPMKRKLKPTSQDAKITFIASPEDQRIIAAGIEKHGLRKMSEVLRMALRRFAESEGLLKVS